jgi:Alpha/beta hydrolase of unknown function (DUF900)
VDIYLAGRGMNGFICTLFLLGLLCAQAKASDMLDVPVLFATDRKLVLTDKSDLDYRDQIPNSDPLPTGKTNNLNYGLKNVLEDEPNAKDLSIAYSKYGWHPSTDSTIEPWRNKTLTEADFFSTVKSLSINLYAPNVVIVYVNGCCQDYQTSVKAAGNVAKTFRVPVVLYSWSAIPNTLLNYIHNEDSCDDAQERFSSFMNRLESELGSGKIAVISHSMGNRLVDTYMSQGRNSPDKMRFVAFACADVNADKFGSTHETKVGAGASKTWVFFNNSDGALFLSKKLHGAYERLGAPHRVLANLINTDKVDFVDHNPLNGNSHDLPVKFMAPLCLLQDGWENSVDQKDNHLYRAKHAR